MNWKLIVKGLMLLFMNTNMSEKMDKKIFIALEPFYKQFKKEQFELKEK